MKFESTPEQNAHISDASYIYLMTNSFEEAFELFEILNLMTYRRRKLRVDFRRGCAKYIAGKICEGYHSASEEQHI
jgi:hypothetical protein